MDGLRVLYLCAVAGGSELAFCVAVLAMLYPYVKVCYSLHN
jgi:hypothetical protein